MTELDRFAGKTLHEAAREGLMETVRELLSGADEEAVNARDKHSRTPFPLTIVARLHLAAWAGQASVAKLLCDSNADVAAAALDDMAAIHFASQKGHTEVVRVLLSAGAYVNSRNRKGMSPLHFAVQGSHGDLAKLLIMKGASLGAENKAGKKPIDLIRHESLHEIIREAELERETRRAKSKEKPKAQIAVVRDETAADAERQGEGETDALTAPIITVRERHETQPENQSEKVENGTRTEESELQTEGGNATEQNAEDVMEPKKKKSKVALSHLFSSNDDDEVD